MKVLFVIVGLYGVLGIGLLYSGVGKMQEKGLPPFNDGLYSAVWSFPSPPVAWIEFADKGVSRVVVFVGTILILSITIRSRLQGRSTTVAFTSLFIWCSMLLFLGTWTWIFSLLN